MFLLLYVLLCKDFMYKVKVVDKVYKLSSFNVQVNLPVLLVWNNNWGSLFMDAELREHLWEQRESAKLEIRAYSCCFCLFSGVSYVFLANFRVDEYTCTLD